MWQLAKNLAALLVGTAVMRLIGLATTLFVARALGPDRFGEFSFAFTAFVLFSLVANLGLENLVVRRVARHEGELTLFLGDAALIKLLAVPVGLLIVWVLNGQTRIPFWLTLWLAGYGLGHAHLMFQCAVFRGLERMERQTWLVSLEAVLIFVGAFTAVRLFDSPTWVAGAYCFGAWGASLLGHLWLRQQVGRLQYRLDTSRLRVLLRQTLPFSLGITGFLLFDRQASLLVYLFDSETAVGWYNAVYFLILATSNVPMIVLNALFPHLSREGVQPNKQQLQHTIRTALRYLNIISFPVAICFFALAPTIIQLFYGEAYLPAVPVMRLLALGIPGLFITVFLHGTLQSNDRQTVTAWGVWLGLLSLPAVAWVISRGGVLWGAWAYAITTNLLAILFLIFIWQDVRRLDWRNSFASPLVAAGGMVIIFAVGQVMPWPLLTGLALLGYALVLCANGLIRAELRGLLTRQLAKL
ncbi:flippase [Candidatus Leptofilum sp.]|uniref:flippase n=1 Tax=Candidatus Leptofilum sp. TaxID=3241576 RepID=UPI003B5C246C